MIHKSNVCEELRNFSNHVYINWDGNGVIDDEDFQAFLKRYPLSSKNEFIACVQKLRADICLPPFHIDFVDRFPFTTRFLDRLEFARDHCAVHLLGKTEPDVPESTEFELKIDSPENLSAQFNISIDQLPGLSGLPITFSTEGGWILWNGDVPVWVPGPNSSCFVHQGIHPAGPTILVDPEGEPVTQEMINELSNLIGEANQNYLKTDVKTLLWYPTNEHGGDNAAIFALRRIELTHAPEEMKQIRNIVMHELAHFRFNELEDSLRRGLSEAEARLRGMEDLSIFQEGTYGVTFSHEGADLDGAELFANASAILKFHKEEFLERLSKLKGKERKIVEDYAKAVTSAYPIKIY